MKNIIIVGYPKSGSTWLTRLTAELVNCSVYGFWKAQHKEMAEEGKDRKSGFKVFKSHHQLYELRNYSEFCKKKIIYVIRDPRDVAISGANYFKFNREKVIRKITKKVPIGKNYLLKALLRILNGEQYRIDQMMNAIFFGAGDVDHWLRISWKDHYTPYMDNGLLFIRYEDLLSSPERESERILSYFNLNRDIAYIKKAIGNQSFEKKKEFFIKNAETAKASFMRVGKSAQWKQKLTEKQKDKFIEKLSNELYDLKYEI